MWLSQVSTNVPALSTKAPPTPFLITISTKVPAYRNTGFWEIPVFNLGLRMLCALEGIHITSNNFEEIRRAYYHGFHWPKVYFSRWQERHWGPKTCCRYCFYLGLIVIVSSALLYMIRRRHEPRVVPWENDGAFDNTHQGNKTRAGGRPAILRMDLWSGRACIQFHPFDAST